MDLDAIDRKILETIEALSAIPGVNSRRGVNPEEVIEKLKLIGRDYANRVENLKRRGFLQVSTGLVAVLTSEGRRVLQECDKSHLEREDSYLPSLLVQY